jgi:hypothetical protein
MLLPCQVHLYTLLLYFSYTSETKPFQGDPQILFLPPIGFFSGHVRAQQFHSVPLKANGNWGSLLQFAFASYMMQNFRQADYSASNLLSLVSCSGLFNHEDGGKMFLRNIGCISTDYTVSYPIRQCFPLPML